MKPSPTVAGRLSDGRPVYFGKKDPSDMSTRDLETWVTLDHPGAGLYVHLEMLGLPDPWDRGRVGMGTPFSSLLHRVECFLALINPATVYAWRNACALESIGEPFPCIDACMAAGARIEDLSLSTHDALADSAPALAMERAGGHD